MIKNILLFHFSQMRQEECSGVGTASLQNKTLQRKLERNKGSCENRRHVVLIEVVVQPVHVPVPLAVVPVQVQDVAVAVRVPEKCIENLPNHHPLNILRIESYLISKYPNSLYQVTSFFMKCLHTPLYLKPWSQILSVCGYWIR